MQGNNPELDVKYLGTITQDFVKISDTLKDASYQLRSRKISNYPIFPMCKEGQPIGQLLLNKGDLNLDWNYFFSFIDEFVQRTLIDEDKLELFKQNYRDPEEFCCLFVIDKEFTNFVYVPYPED